MATWWFEAGKQVLRTETLKVNLVIGDPGKALDLRHNSLSARTAKLFTVITFYN